MKREGIIFWIGLVWVIVLQSFGISLNDDVAGLTIQANPESKDTVVYAYIVSLDREGDRYLLRLDFVQFFWNAEAVEMAKKRGDADTLYKDGKMIVSVPGDYYVVNDSRKIRRYYLSKDVVYSFQLNDDRKNPIKNNSWDSLRKIYKDSFFRISIRKNQIIAVEEVFLP